MSLQSKTKSDTAKRYGRNQIGYKKEDLNNQLIRLRYKNKL